MNIIISAIIIRLAGYEASFKNCSATTGSQFPLSTLRRLLIIFMIMMTMMTMALMIMVTMVTIAILIVSIIIGCSPTLSYNRFVMKNMIHPSKC